MLFSINSSQVNGYCCLPLLHVVLQVICRLTGHECSLVTARASTLSSDVISMSTDGIIKVTVRTAWDIQITGSRWRTVPKKDYCTYRHCLFHIVLDKEAKGDISSLQHLVLAVSATLTVKVAYSTTVAQQH